MKKLTQKQAKFCENIVQVMPYADAYNGAGYKSTSTSDATTKAYNLLCLPHIKAEVQRLREIRIEKIGGITKEYVLDLLNELAQQNNCKTSKISAIKQICKIMGYESAENININSDTPLFIVKDLNNKKQD